MTRPTPRCAICDAPPGKLERLAHDWWFCNGCRHCYVLDEKGEVAHVLESSHAKKRPDITRPA